MLPFLIHYKSITIPTFFFMVMVASLAAAFYIYYQAPKKGLSQIVVLDLAMVGTIVGIIGARLFHVFVEAPGYYWEHPTYVFHFWRGGFVGYGVFIGILLGVIGYLKIRKLPILKYCDLIALGCPLIVFFVRIGCLGAGCCYGTPTDFFIHLTFTNPSSDGGRDFPGVALHATQIYDMINAIITFGVVHWVDKRKKFQGQVMITFFMTYAFFRFWIEFLRGDEDRGVYFGGVVSTSQITGAVFILFGFILYRYWKKKYPVTA